MNQRLTVLGDWCSRARASSGIERSAISLGVEDLLHPGEVVSVADDVVGGVCGLPDHDTTESGVAVHLAYESLDLRGLKVVASVARGGSASRKTNEELDVAVERLDASPVVVALEGAGSDSLASRASGGVVVLNKEEIEPSILDNTSKVLVGNNTLRCT
jgi:hypothetical protein